MALAFHNDAPFPHKRPGIRVILRACDQRRANRVRRDVSRGSQDRLLGPQDMVMVALLPERYPCAFLEGESGRLLEVTDEGRNEGGTITVTEQVHMVRHNAVSQNGDAMLCRHLSQVGKAEFGNSADQRFSAIVALVGRRGYRDSSPAAGGSVSVGRLVAWRDANGGRLKPSATLAAPQSTSHTQVALVRTGTVG